MLQIYIDWNIISDISSGNLERFSDLISQGIDERHFTAFFTDQHIWEATNIPEDHPRRNELINSALDTIDTFCPLYYERIPNSDDYKWYIANPRDVFSQKGEFIKIFRESLIEVLDNVRFSKLREIVDNPPQLAPYHLNNFNTKEVLDEINRILNTKEVTELYGKEIEPPITFSKLLEYSSNLDDHFQGLFHQYLQHAHFLLDSLGFRSDKRSNLGFVGSWMCKLPHILDHSKVEV